MLLSSQLDCAPKKSLASQRSEVLDVSQHQTASQWNWWLVQLCFHRWDAVSKLYCKFQRQGRCMCTWHVYAYCKEWMSRRLWQVLSLNTFPLSLCMNFLSYLVIWTSKKCEWSAPLGLVGNKEPQSTGVQTAAETVECRQRGLVFSSVSGLAHWPATSATLKESWKHERVSECLWVLMVCTPNGLNVLHYAWYKSSLTHAKSIGILPKWVVYGCIYSETLSMNKSWGAKTTGLRKYCVGSFKVGNQCLPVVRSWLVGSTVENRFWESFADYCTDMLSDIVSFCHFSICFFINHELWLEKHAGLLDF